ncbi:uncharacterized protein E5676_scaffold83G002000 [Cucumis melo var. makuwa]|uniref:Uncharacterized protein n=1 Tax=Cucumis melo var. makuwa TaxID=1194695 RepID=A0A5D3C0P6_CUCMM|nr:uncharacterized protein E5676_scaffold83G002000 [Cucumis melo var. makuwa]
METLLLKYMQRNDVLLQSQATFLKNLELQLGQLARDFFGRLKGPFPSNTETPNQMGGYGKEKCQNNNVLNKQIESTRRDEQHDKVFTKVTSSNPLSPLPFLEQMPSYVKFLKNILVKKRRINECETVDLTQATSNVLKNGIPEKMIDLKAFTVPCSIGRMDLGHALCDSGASIDLMPLSIFT